MNPTFLDGLASIPFASISVKSQESDGKKTLTVQKVKPGLSCKDFAGVNVVLDSGDVYAISQCEQYGSTIVISAGPVSISYDATTGESTGTFSDDPGGVVVAALTAVEAAELLSIAKGE